MVLNSVDLKHWIGTFLKKTVQKQATLWITVGKRTGFGPLFGPLFGHFFDKLVNFFDVVVTW